MTVDRADLIAAFGMPPEAAVEFLRSKGLVVTEGWRDLWKSAHSRAFTVAQSAGYDVLGDIRQALLDAMTKGQSFKQFLDELKPVLQSKGWWGKAIDPTTGEITKTYPGTGKPVQLGSPRRLKLIFEQNLQTAFMAGRYRSMYAATDTHPYWQYVAVLDARTRPTHRAMNGRTFRHDDVAIGVIYPPCGWRCRCRMRPLSLSALIREGISLSSGENYLSEVELAPRKDGSIPRVKQLALPGMKPPFRPDVGWDYNPAESYRGAN